RNFGDPGQPSSMSWWIAPRASPYTGLAPKNETQHKPDPERSKARFRRAPADILLDFLLKTADAMARVIPILFRVAPILISHCARCRAEVFRRFAGVGHATLCLFSRLRRSRSALVHLVFVSHRISPSSSFV